MMTRAGLGVVLAMLLVGWPPLGRAADSDTRTTGRSDLEGLWSSASLTPLERPATFAGLVASATEAAAFEAAHNGSPISGPDVSGQVESEWWEMGSRLARIDGQARTSLVVAPADGRLPYTAAGRDALVRSRTAMLRDFDGPEARPAPERCLIGLGGTSLPPMLNSGYNNNMQIVQTDEHVVIVTEMNHDARIIPLAAGSAGVSYPTWTGNSVGRWEGGVLVVETSGFHPALGWRAPSALYLSPRAKVTERFRRVSTDEIRYSFEVTDPEIYTQPWRGETALRRTARPIYEFACHEGNYSLTNVLSGARQAEVEAKGGR